MNRDDPANLDIDMMETEMPSGKSMFLGGIVWMILCVLIGFGSLALSVWIVLTLLGHFGVIALVPPLV